MLFPEAARFQKRITKQKFYENLDVSPALKRAFIDQIQTVYWSHKLSPETIKIAPGEDVLEIEIFEIKLTSKELDETVLRQIDKQIPYHIVFLLEHDGQYQAWTAYKEASTGNAAFKVNRYYHTAWMTEEMLPLKVEGLNMDAVYENFVYQIAGDALRAENGKTLQAAVERAEKIKKLKKQIEVLQAKIHKEKQLNVQMKLNSELKKLKKELERI